ncbi:GNAT family N-acetyltransferase [Marinobacterium jannaschii]|uniref:GNAT family N-acetyltransferase n=1 Tax=Marinobacterium jannaschii TaxID=64970 RepID=UPI000687DC24|nr:GNAT family N-acetyltransferase [Marinobacterium jannaschii]
MICTINEIEPGDDSVICEIIKKVGAEYGAIGDGFGPSDSEVLCMSQNYSEESKSRYLVARIDGKVVGGCGIAPFNGSSDICELKKLFLLPESRGSGLGRKLTLQCLEFAVSQGFKNCYLDTLKSMSSAIALYEKLGFSHLNRPLQGTEHNGCDVWMLKPL